MSTDSPVMTVLGPVAGSELGVTLPHEHLVIDLTRQVIQGGRINDLGLLEKELSAFAAIGVLLAATGSVAGHDPRDRA